MITFSNSSNSEIASSAAASSKSSSEVVAKALKIISAFESHAKNCECCNTVLGEAVKNDK